MTETCHEKKVEKKYRIQQVIFAVSAKRYQLKIGSKSKGKN